MDKVMKYLLSGNLELPIQNRKESFPPTHWKHLLLRKVVRSTNHAWAFNGVVKKAVMFLLFLIGWGVRFDRRTPFTLQTFAMPNTA